MDTYLIHKNSIGGLLDAKKVEDDANKTLIEILKTGDWTLDEGDSIIVARGTYDGFMFIPEQ